MLRVQLEPHPATPAAGVDALSASVVWLPAAGLELSFRVQGRTDALRVPPHRKPRRTDGLWRHTCCEAFVMAGDGPAYRELNFSPSGEWAAYEFCRYREGGPLDVELEPAVVWRDRNRLQVDVRVPAACVPQTGNGAGLRLGLAVVLEDVDGTLSYWALRHLAPRPDFHHPGSFALDAAWPRGTPSGPVARSTYSQGSDPCE